MLLFLKGLFVFQSWHRDTRFSSGSYTNDGVSAAKIQLSSVAQVMQTPLNTQQVTDISSSQWNWLESKMNCNKASPRSPRGKHWRSKVNIYCTRGRYFNRPGNVGPRLDLSHSLEPLSILFRSCVLCYIHPAELCRMVRNHVGCPPFGIFRRDAIQKLCVRILCYHCLCKVTNVFAQ